MDENQVINEEKLSEQLQRLLLSIAASGRAILPKSNDVLLKSIVEAAPRLGAGGPATLMEVEAFIGHMPGLKGMSPKERAQLASDTLVAEAPGGKVITYRGEESDAAFFILKGRTGAGYIRDGEYVILGYMQEGDFFGEVAALTGLQLTANVITEEDSQLLIIPARVIQQLTQKHSALNVRLHTTIGERLSLTELPLGTSLDQGCCANCAPASLKWKRNLPRHNVAV